MISIPLQDTVRRVRGPIRQTCHVIYEVAYFLVSLISRITNAVVFKGSMHQTLSARAHIESYTDSKWAKTERRINLLWTILSLGYYTDHCEDSWESEVSRAYKTLDRNKVKAKDKVQQP